MANKSSSSNAASGAITAVLAILLIIPWLLIKGITFIIKAIAGHSKSKVDKNARNHTAEAQERHRQEIWTKEKREQEILAELKKQNELNQKIANNSKCAGCRKQSTCNKLFWRDRCYGPF